MKFTRFHWSICTLVTLLAAMIFDRIAKYSGQEWFMIFALISFVYALFSLIRMLMYRDHRHLDDLEDEMLYKTNCPHCHEMLAGHELYCPKCGMFLPKRKSSQ